MKYITRFNELAIRFRNEKDSMEREKLREAMEVYMHLIICNKSHSLVLSKFGKKLCNHFKD